MDVKEQILIGLKPALTALIKTDLDSGKIKSPVRVESMVQAAWHALRMDVQTSGALLLFGIKKEDIATIVKQVFADLKVAVK